MAITESTRHQLHQALIDALGEQEAATLMEHLPPIGWADVATKSDLDHLRVSTKTDIEHLRTVTEARFEQLHMEMVHRFDMADARLDTKVADLRSEITDQFREAQRWQLGALGSIVAICSAVLGVLILVT